MSEIKNKTYKTALVLSGGGVRGFAHLGAIKALNEHGIFPDIISGTSAGAVAAVLYADGYTPDEAMSLFKEKELLKYLEFIIPKTGLVKMTGMVKLLKNHIRAKTFEDLKIPVYISACNISKGRGEYFSTGELLKPLIASVSIPVLFSPVKLNDAYYVDGGIMDNFPVSPVEKIAEMIIGVFVNPINTENDFNNIKKIALRTFQLSVNKNVQEKSKKCNIFISPPKLSNYGVLEVKKIEEVFNLGYKEAVKVLKLIHE